MAVISVVMHHASDSAGSPGNILEGRLPALFSLVLQIFTLPDICRQLWGYYGGEINTTVQSSAADLYLARHLQAVVGILWR